MSRTSGAFIMRNSARPAKGNGRCVHGLTKEGLRRIKYAQRPLIGPHGRHPGAAPRPAPEGRPGVAAAPGWSGEGVSGPEGALEGAPEGLAGPDGPDGAKCPESPDDPHGPAGAQ